MNDIEYNLTEKVLSTNDIDDQIGKVSEVYAIVSYMEVDNPYKNPNKIFKVKDIGVEEGVALQVNGKLYRAERKKGDSYYAYDIDEFHKEMEEKSYDIQIKDAQQDFIPATRKRMIIGNEVLDIYLFANNKSMEKEAKAIDSGGSQYNSGLVSINASWISTPHFYKRGRIIVQYIGRNEKIISDLKNILGEQFAGGK